METADRSKYKQNVYGTGGCQWERKSCLPLEKNVRDFDHSCTSLTNIYYVFICILIYKYMYLLDILTVERKLPNKTT